jgi:hypothetical protein
LLDAPWDCPFQRGKGKRQEQSEWMRPASGARAAPPSKLARFPHNSHQSRLREAWPLRIKQHQLLDEHL